MLSTNTTNGGPLPSPSGKKSGQHSHGGRGLNEAPHSGGQQGDGYQEKAGTRDGTQSGAPLGTTYETNNPPLRIRAEEARALRFYRQAVARELLPGERVASCMGFVVPGKHAEVHYNVKHSRAHVCNVAVCGSIWTCPVCAAKITERRRADLKQAIQTSGLALAMATFTLQHNPGDRLAGLISDLNQAYTATKNGAPWKRLCAKHGVVGYITALEVTRGAAGWHPHKHTLLFLEGPTNLDELRGELQARFSRILERRGRYSSAYHGVNVQEGQAAVEYVNKWGLADELTKAAVKKAKQGGLSPFELLDAAGRGDRAAGWLFKEYAAAMKGKAQLSPSRGLYDLIGLRNQSDQELAEEKRENGDVLLGRLTAAAWRLIWKNKAVHDLLKVADLGDPDLVAAFLADYGLTWA